MGLLNKVLITMKGASFTKRQRMLLIFVFCISIMLLTSCSSKKSANIDTNVNEYNSIAIPESIVYYNKGIKKTFTKVDDKFDSIVNLTNERVKNIKDSSKSIFPMDNLKDKGLLLEFSYSQKQKFEYYTEKRKKVDINYTKLYFILDKNDSKYNQMAFDGDGYGPIGPLDSSDDLLKLLNQ